MGMEFSIIKRPKRFMKVSFQREGNKVKEGI